MPQSLGQLCWRERKLLVVPHSSKGREGGARRSAVSGPKCWGVEELGVRLTNSSRENLRL
jgi:hypothetical protein